jgi:hypothetical protein
MAIRNDGAEPALQGRSLRAGADAVLVERTDDFTTLRSVRERLLQCGISTALMSESGQKVNCRPAASCRLTPLAADMPSHRLWPLGPLAALPSSLQGVVLLIIG